MTLTVVDHYSKGLVQYAQEGGASIRQQVERRTWSLWHGTLSQALSTIDDLGSVLARCEVTSPQCQALVTAVQECRTSMAHTGTCIPHDGERSRCGEATATGCVASTVTRGVRQRCCKQQHMPWSTRGAPLVRHTHVTMRNGAWVAVCTRWSPDLQREAAPQAA